jgi:hypothetical protein
VSCYCDGVGYTSLSVQGQTVYVDCNRDLCWAPATSTTYEWGPTGVTQASCVGDGDSYPACDYCDDLAYAGLSDWTLPNYGVLGGLLVNTHICTPSQRTCFGSDGGSAAYWSSTGSGLNLAYVCSTATGDHLQRTRVTNAPVRCVRGLH